MKPSSLKLVVPVGWLSFRSCGHAYLIAGWSQGYQAAYRWPQPCGDCL